MVCMGVAVKAEVTRYKYNHSLITMQWHIAQTEVTACAYTNAPRLTAKTEQRRIQVLGGGGGTDGGCGWGWGRLLARYEKRGGGGGGAVGLWPDTRSGGGGGGVLSVYGPIRGAGGGGGGAVGFWPKTKSGGGGGGGGCCWFLARYEGRGGGKYDRVSGGPGYSTVVEFMRADINRQRNRAAIL